MTAPTPDTSLGCEYCSGENDKPGWKGSYSDDGAIGYVACWNCNPNGLPSPADTSPGDELEYAFDGVIAATEKYGPNTPELDKAMDEAKDRLNRLMLTWERERLETIFIQSDGNNTLKLIDDAIAAIDAQLNKEEK